MYKFLIIAVVLLAAVGGLWYTGWLTKLVPMIPMMKSAKVPEVPAPAATTTAQTEQKPPAPINDLPTATDDASDQALVQDAAAIDTQISELTTDNANAASSLSDKPVTQEY